jgi:hypothetical protein
VSFAAIILFVASQRVFIVVIVYFVTDSVRKLLDTHSYKQKRLNHVNKMEVIRYPKQLLDYRPIGRRRPGRLLKETAEAGHLLAYLRSDQIFGRLSAL